MYGLFMRVWELEGEEEHSLLVPGLASLSPLLLRLLGLVKQEAGLQEQEAQLLVTTIPPALLSGKPPHVLPWSASGTLKKVQENLKQHQGEGEEVKESEEFLNLEFIDDFIQPVDVHDKSDDEDEEEDNNNSDLIAQHIIPTPKVKSEFECIVCGELFPLLKELRVHQESSHEELFCSKCGTASQDLDHVRNRLNS